MRTLRFQVAEEEAGVRVDLFLVSRLTSESRTSIRDRIRSGRVLVNLHTVKPAQKLKTGDRVEVHMDPSVSTEDGRLSSWDRSLEILHGDRWLIAVNKPSGVVVHPGAGRREQTLAQAVLHHYPEIRNVGHPLRPGVVHRLDRETSGAILFARTPEAYLALSAMFRERKIRKHYRVLAYGKFSRRQGRVEKPIGRDPGNRKKISTRAAKTRSAITLFTVLKQYAFGALLDVEILTGRTHQVRVHLNSENHPIIGDSKYGGGNWNRIADVELRTRLKTAGFFGLHALCLDFVHPFTNTPLRIEAPLPEIWQIVNRTDSV